MSDADTRNSGGGWRARQARRRLRGQWRQCQWGRT